ERPRLREAFRGRVCAFAQLLSALRNKDSLLLEEHVGVVVDPDPEDLDHGLLTRHDRSGHDRVRRGCDVAVTPWRAARAAVHHALDRDRTEVEVRARAGLRERTG